MYLYLDRNLLEGPLPDSLVAIDDLKDLVVYRNSELSGIIPSALCTKSDLDIEMHGTNIAPCLCSQQTRIVLEDCVALVALYNSNNGSVWENNDGWLTDDSPCSWEGVTCQFGSDRVSGLSLDDNRLTGEFPAELWDLTGLTDLILSGNTLGPELPDEIGKLVNLKHIDLHDNNLQGPIPASIGNIPGLENLYLSDNSLEGTLPGSLGGLDNLKNLGVSNNPALSGPVPPELCAKNDLFMYLMHTKITPCP